MTLKELRKQHNLTEAQMAERVNLSRPGLQKVEKGRPTTTTTLQAIASALGHDLLTVVSAWQASRQPENNAYSG